MSSNIKEWKTTLLGVLLIVVDIYYLLFLKYDKITFFGVLAVSVALLFAPDNLIGGIKSLIDKNKNKEL